MAKIMTPVVFNLLQEPAQALHPVATILTANAWMERNGVIVVQLIIEEEFTQQPPVTRHFACEYLSAKPNNVRPYDSNKKFVCAFENVILGETQYIFMR